MTRAYMTSDRALALRGTRPARDVWGDEGDA